MRTLARLQIKAFARRRPLMLIAALTVIAVVAAGTFEILGVLRHDAALADILSNFTRYSIVWPLVVAVLAYETASAPRLLGMEESIAVCSETANEHWLAVLVPPSLLLATIFSVYLALRLVAVSIAHQLGLLGWHIVAEALLNVLLPSAIGMLLGAVVARHLRRFAGFAVIALFAFVIGPYFEIVPALAQWGIGAGRAGLDLYPVYDLFRLLAPDPTWGMDPLYGFPLELGRWMLAAMWLLGLLAALLPALVRPRARAVRPARLVMVSLSALALLAVLLPSSELRRDDRFFNAASQIENQIYYDIQVDKHPQRQDPARFAVSRYGMELAAGRQLSATVSMDISDDEHVDAYRFTLYHGYRVTRALGSKGERLGFTQEGDYLAVTSATKQARLTLEYAGSGGICIANYQCVFLPGYFPYYPVPGLHRTWNAARTYVSTPAGERSPAEFSVAFDAPMPLLSGLKEHDGRFEGRAVAPSFVGGLLTQDTIGGYRVVYYPSASVDPRPFADAVARLHELEQAFGVRDSAVRENTTIFMMPYLAQSDSGAVVLPDAVYVAAFDKSIAAEILVADLPARLDRENLKDAFAFVINNPDQISDAGGERPSDKEIADLERARLAARNDTECVQRYRIPAMSVVRWLFLEKLRAQDTDAALRETYRYLASDSPESELEFLTQASKGER